MDWDGLVPGRWKEGMDTKMNVKLSNPLPCKSSIMLCVCVCKMHACACKQCAGNGSKKLDKCVKCDPIVKKLLLF